AFVSFRYALPILVVAGSVCFFRGSQSRAARRRFICLMALLLIPFLISFLRNELPFDRTFVHLAPIFALLTGAAVAALPGGWLFLRRRPVLAQVAFYLYCVATLVYGHRII